VSLDIFPTLAELADASPVAAPHGERRSDTAGELPRLAYSLKEVAKILGISYVSVWRLVQRGVLKSSTALRHKLIPLTEIQRFLRTTTK
jgi:hypothetical protein